MFDDIPQIVYPSIIIDNQDPTQKNSKDGLFGKKRLIANQLYRLVSKHEFRKTAYVALNLCYAVDHLVTDDAYVTVIITDKLDPVEILQDLDSIVEYRIKLTPGLTFERSYFILDPTEQLYVISTASGVVARADGHDKRIS